MESLEILRDSIWFTINYPTSKMVSGQITVYVREIFAVDFEFLFTVDSTRALYVYSKFTRFPCLQSTSYLVSCFKPNVFFRSFIRFLFEEHNWSYFLSKCFFEVLAKQKYLGIEFMLGC